jgi:hypothetical protein
VLTKNVEAEALGTNGALAHAQVDPWRTSQLAIGLLTGMHRAERFEPALRASAWVGLFLFSSSPLIFLLFSFSSRCFFFDSLLFFPLRSSLLLSTPL